MIIHRNIESKILHLLKSFPVVGIIGPRQVGKTTLAKTLMKLITKKSIYIDLELPEQRILLNDPALFLRKYTNECIVIDEIQLLPEIFPALRGLIDENRIPARFILLGSASPKLKIFSSESLAGRIAYIELNPFNITEIESKDNLQKLWFRGGFPNAYLAADEGVTVDWLNNFIQTYLTRDLPSLGMSANSALCYRFLTMLAHYNGSIWNGSTIASSLSLSVPTVNSYLDFFENSFLITRLQPYFNSIKKRLIKSPKIYFRDTGILHRLSGIDSSDSLNFFPKLGTSWETFVIEQIKQMAHNKWNLYYYRTHDGAEVDLVLCKGSNPEISIEIKHSSTPHIERGTTISLSDLGTEKNFIIVPFTSHGSYPLNKNIVVCELYEFLSKFL